MLDKPAMARPFPGFELPAIASTTHQPGVPLNIYLTKNSKRLDSPGRTSNPGDSPEDNTTLKASGRLDKGKSEQFVRR